MASEFRCNRRHPIATCLSEHRGLRQSLSSAAPSGGGNWMHQSDEGMKKNHLSSPRHPEHGKTAARGLRHGVTGASTARWTHISGTCGPPASVAVTWWTAQRLACRPREKTQTLTKAALPEAPHYFQGEHCHCWRSSLETKKWPWSSSRRKSSGSSDGSAWGGDGERYHTRTISTTSGKCVPEKTLLLQRLEVAII